MAATNQRSCRSEEHTSELQSPCNLVCRLLLEKKTRPSSNEAVRWDHRRRLVRAPGRAAAARRGQLLAAGWEPPLQVTRAGGALPLQISQPGRFRRRRWCIRALVASSRQSRLGDVPDWQWSADARQAWIRVPQEWPRHTVQGKGYDVEGEAGA